MKKTNIFVYGAAIVFLLSISLLNLSFDNHTQKHGKKLSVINEDDPIYFWFFVRVRIDTRQDKFIMSGTTGGIRTGRQIDFEKDLWSNLSRRQIAVGPFESKNEAVNAKRLYKTKKKLIKSLPKGEVPAQVTWFAVTFEQSPRLRIFVIKRAPGAVFTGSEQMFIDAFFEQLNYKLLTIGPFYNYDQAELAKRLYRKNE
jgi:hypothetical protein